MNGYYLLSIDNLFEKFNSGQSGLSSEETQIRLQQYGLNALPHGKKVTLFSIILNQFKSPLIYVLIACAFISALIQQYDDAGFILAIIIINATLGAMQEWKAEASASALQNLVKTQARVLRDGESILTDAEFLVPGDVVMVESGMKVPADIRLSFCNNLGAEESILTGESLAVNKSAETLEKENLPVGDQRNMLFAGTTVVSGRGRGIVVATGLHTEIGKIAKYVSETRQSQTPLVKRMEKFARVVSLVVLVACAILFVVGIIKGISPIDIFFTAVAVAVSAIPEGLPVAMTVALSIGTSRMAKRNVIVRRLSAVEGLGSCNYIATDKTGTLTVDQQTVKRITLHNNSSFEVEGAGYNGEGKVIDQHGKPVTSPGAAHSFIEAVALCNEADLLWRNNTWRHSGDAIDVAFLGLVYKYGLNPEEIRSRATILHTIPFESEHKYAAVFYRDEQGEIKAAMKGAFEAVIEYCEGVVKSELLAINDSIASQGYRVIAVAAGNADRTYTLKNLSFLGFGALIDPLKPEAKGAVEICHGAEIKVAMITGDHPATAFSIAKELNMASSDDQVINGMDLGSKTGDNDLIFREKIRNKTVFARVSPAQKQQIVAELKGLGNFVAVTGDGVNDAPALKTANIGVAMGYGSDVAKEAASIIVTDNNFASIASGIEEGRYTYSNLRKIIYLLISTGSAEIIMVFLSLLAGLPLPFLPVQLLWLNLVTNGTQDIALAFEKGEKYLIKEPPRDASQGIFDKLMVSQTLTAGFIMTVCTFGLWYHLLKNLHYQESEARNIILLLMVMLQNFHVFNCRSEKSSIFRIPLSHNHFIWLSVIIAQGVHIFSMHNPFMQNLLGVRPVTFNEWILLLAAASAILVGMEVFKLVYARTGQISPMKNRDRHAKR